MSNVMSNFVKQIVKTTAAAGLAVTLLGSGVAVAHEPTLNERVQAEMNQGKDYSAAWAAASRAVGASTSPELAARIIRAESQLNEGKDYVAANGVASKAAGPVYAPTALAQAQRVEAQMNEGKDYVAAREASEKPAPTVSAKAGGVTTTASVRTAR